MKKSPKSETVTARLIFRGVMLACINSRGHYEVGMVVCPNHAPKITVQQVAGRSVSEYSPVWPKDHDLIFNVTNPHVEGVSFDPLTNQDTSFSRVLDMEGFLLHRRRVAVDRARLQGRRLAVTAGKLYTHNLSTKEFDLLTWTDDEDPGTLRGHIGTIAQEVGLNIVCRNEAGSGIQLMDLETKDEICAMPVVNGRTYTVTIENDCKKGKKVTGSDAEIGTDFRYFYKQGFVKSSDGLKFDLGYERSGKRKESPDACENGFLGKTNTLGIKKFVPKRGS